MSQPELKFIIYEKEKVIHTVQRTTLGDPEHLIKSLEEFRQAVNEKLTEIIEDDGRIDMIHLPDDDFEDEVSSSEDEGESNQHISPKKRKT